MNITIINFCWNPCGTIFWPGLCLSDSFGLWFRLVFYSLMIAICICRNSSLIGFASSLAVDSTASCLTILFQFLKSWSVCGSLFIVIFMCMKIIHRGMWYSSHSSRCFSRNTCLSDGICSCTCFKFGKCQSLVRVWNIGLIRRGMLRTSYKKSTNYTDSCKGQQGLCLSPLRFKRM